MIGDGVADDVELFSHHVVVVGKQLFLVLFVGWCGTADGAVAFGGCEFFF